MQEMVGPEAGKWFLGRCIRKVAPRSYLVKIKGRICRRNRIHLRPDKRARDEEEWQWYNGDNKDLSNEESREEEVRREVDHQPMRRRQVEPRQSMVLRSGRRV